MTASIYSGGSDKTIIGDLYCSSQSYQVGMVGVFAHREQSVLFKIHLLRLPARQLSLYAL